MKLVPIIICVDVEPDQREIDVDRREPWHGFVETYEVFSELRPRLERATGAPVRFSWFLRMDPQVEVGYGSASWVVDRYPEILADLQLKDELGLHIHATRWDKSSRGWIGDYADQEWVATCVTTAFNAFEKAFRRPCKSVSFGDRWSSDEAIALAEKLGAEFVVSLEPGARPSGLELGYQFTGQWPNYGRVPTHVYRPSIANHLQAQAGSQRDIWIIPLSAGKYEGAKTFRFWQFKRLAKSLGIEFQRDSESTTLRLHIPLDVFRKTVEGLLKISNASYLAAVVRSDVGGDLPKRANLEMNFEYLLNHPQISSFRFTTPAETIKMVAGE